MCMHPGAVACNSAWNAHSDHTIFYLKKSFWNFHGGWAGRQVWSVIRQMDG